MCPTISSIDVEVGDIIDREQADHLPAWSRIERADDPSKLHDLIVLPWELRRFPALEKLPTGLWLADRPGKHYGGIGSGLFQVVRIGPA